MLSPYQLGKTMVHEQHVSNLSKVFRITISHSVIVHSQEYNYVHMLQCESAVNDFSLLHKHKNNCCC